MKYSCLNCGIVHVAKTIIVADYEHDETYEDYLCPYCDGYLLEIKKFTFKRLKNEN